MGFEPTESRDSALFKSAAFNRSATSPVAKDIVPAEPDPAAGYGSGTWSYEDRSFGAFTTTVLAMRSCQPRLRLSMKIQM